MKKKIVFLPYDFDTAIGINNEGGLTFSYNLEDIDQTESGADIFNGQQSVLWKNMRAAFFEEMRTMYQNLRSTGALSYEKVEQMFEEHQAKWPEAVFNEDAWFKYLAPLVEKGNGSYLSMLQGSKAEQRKWWLYNRFRYIDSKYNAGDSLSDVITVRGYAKSDISVTPYADIYATIKYGSYLVQTRAARNNTYILACPLDNVNDTEIYIYSASQLSDVGDLSGLMVGYADFSKAVRLQNLKIGDSDPQYDNGNLTELYLGNNELLRTLDVRNCSALKEPVDISGCSNIEQVYFDGTGITGLSLPNGGILKTLHLPGSLVNLTILNQTVLTDFVLPSAENLTTLRLENVSSAVNSLALLRGMPANSRVRILGAQWQLPSYTDITSIYSILDTMRGTDEVGGNTEKAQISATIHVPVLSTDQKRALQSRYADIRLEADLWMYRVRFFHDGELVHTAYVASGSDAADPASTGIIPTPEKPAEEDVAYAFAGWDGALTNITEDTDVHSTFEAHPAYKVTFQNYDGTVLLVKKVAEGSNCPDPIQTGEIATPERPGDSTYVYSFLGWTGGSLINVTADRTLTARFTETASYTITFEDYDGTVLLTWYRSYGAAIVDPIKLGLVETPVRPDNWSSGLEYTFWKWDGQNNDGTFPTVSGNKTYVPKYNTTSFYGYYYENYDGTELYREKWRFSETATDPITYGRMPAPTRPDSGSLHYEYFRWDVSFPHTVSGPRHIKAIFRSDAVHTVTFKDWDNTVLDVQQVRDRDNAVDPVKTGKIGTPLRPSTQQYDYTYKGWNKTFNEITANVIVTASYDAVLRSYTVTLLDGSTELAKFTTEYGTPARYLYDKDIVFSDQLPVPTVDSEKIIVNWTPSISDIRADTVAYPVWADVLTDSWEDIFAAEEDGTYLTKYKLGDMKLLDLGPEGVLAMRIAAFDVDDKADGSGKAHITWVAMTPLNSKRCYAQRDFTSGTTRPSVYYFQEIQDETLGTYYQATNSEEYTVGCARFSLSATEETDITVTAFASSQGFHEWMDVWLDNEIILKNIGSIEGDTRTYTIHLAAGTTKVVQAQFARAYPTELGQQHIARISFASEGSFTVKKTNTSSLIAQGGTPEGWKDSHLRDWFTDYLFPLIPSTVASHILEVTKISAIDKNGNYVTTQDKLWLPSAGEVCGPSNNVERTGTQYALRGNPITNYYGFRKNGLPIRWLWLRTQNRLDQTYKSGLITDDSIQNYFSNYAVTLHVVIGFCT